MLSSLSGFDADSLILLEPTAHAVVQRDYRNLGEVAVEGTVASQTVTRIEARAVARDGFAGTGTSWETIDETLSEGSFSGSLTVSAGWYELEVRAYCEQTLVGETSIEQVGVGEVFVTAGQSNSANYGTERLTPQDERVSAYGPDGWQLAADPQPIATGKGGSPWPALGDRLAQQYDVPIGFISVGVGGTRVDEWLRDGPYYPRLQEAIESLGPYGLRAVLWHQGEYDNYKGTSNADYAARLSAVISQSRVDAGWNVPWGVALAGYLTYGTPEGQAAIVAAQEQVIADDPAVFQGASTDDLTDPTVRRPDTHFTGAGLREHAARWAESIIAMITEPVPMAVDPGLDDSLRMSPDGSEVTIYGSEGEDTFELAAGSPHVVTVGGRRFESDRMTHLTIVGGGGCDTFTLEGTNGDESAILRPHGTTVAGPGYVCELSDVATVTLHGGGGNDSATFFDSPGNDDFVGAPGFASLAGEGTSQTVFDFNSVQADAVAGGLDVAKLFDSAGNDQLVTTPVYARLYGSGFSLQVEHFEGVHAYAGAGGIDIAKMFDSPGDDTFYADPTSAALYGEGHFHRAKHFEGVHAYATSGGLDVARLFDSPGDDTFFSMPESSALFGDGFYNRAKFFERVDAQASAGGTDRARLFDSPADDLLTVSADWARLVGDLSAVWLNGFKSVHATGSNGGTNTVEFSAVDYLLQLAGEWQ